MVTYGKISSVGSPAPLGRPSRVRRLPGPCPRWGCAHQDVLLSLQKHESHHSVLQEKRSHTSARLGRKAKAIHPSKPCRTMSTLAARAYAAAGQAESVLHRMAVLQVCQDKLLHKMDETGPDLAAFKQLRSATNLGLNATKSMAQAIRRVMANLVVLERHLWLN